jgi:hypothetical protein
VKNQRKSPRVAAAAEHRHCELRLRSAVVPGVLLNESLEGFAVLVGGRPNISANQTAQLRNHRGWYDVRIIYATEVVPAKSAGDTTSAEQAWGEDDGPATITAADIAAFPGGAQGPWYRLGIRRLREIAPPTQPVAAPPVESRSLNPVRWIRRMLATARDR